MQPNAASPTGDSSRKHRLISLLLLGGLLFLRFPFLIVTVGLIDLPPELRGVVFFTFTGLTYLLTGILIWWERDRLHEFWIDLAAGITFLCQFYYFLGGIALFWFMRRSGARFPRPPHGVWRWALIGAIAAIAVETVLITVFGLRPPTERTPQVAGFGYLFSGILIQMTNAAVWEEPLFRGFLWGYLRQARWKNVWIWLFQAALFTAGHVYYLRTEAFGPWFVRMIVPSLLIGLIAWQARSIFASMLTHGAFNAIADMLNHTRSLDEAVQVAVWAMLILGVVLVIVWAVELIHRRSAAAPAAA